MFNIVMALIIGFDCFLAAQSIIEYAGSGDWRHSAGFVMFASLAAWALIRTIKVNQ